MLVAMMGHTVHMKYAKHSVHSFYRHVRRHANRNAQNAENTYNTSNCFQRWGRRTKQNTENAGNRENGGSYSFSNETVYPLMFSLPLPAGRVGWDLWWCNNQLTALWGRLWPVQGAGHEAPLPRCHQWGGCWVRGAGIGLPHAGATGWGWEALRPTASSASG